MIDELNGNNVFFFFVNNVIFCFVKVSYTENCIEYLLQKDISIMNFNNVSL